MIFRYGLPEDEHRKTLILDPVAISPVVSVYAGSLAWDLRELIWLKLECVMLAVLIAYAAHPCDRQLGALASSSAGTETGAPGELTEAEARQI